MSALFGRRSSAASQAEKIEGGGIKFGRGRRKSQRAVHAFFERAADRRSLKSGETLITAYEPNENIYLIVDGRIVAKKSDTDATATLSLAQGELLGFRSFLMGTLPVKTWAVSDDGEGATVLVLPFARALQLMKDDAKLTMHIFHEVAAEMAERIQKVSQGVRESVINAAPNASGMEHEDRVALRAPPRAAAGSAASRFFDKGLPEDAELVLSVPVSVVYLEKNSNGRQVGSVKRRSTAKERRGSSTVKERRGSATAKERRGSATATKERRPSVTAKDRRGSTAAERRGSRRGSASFIGSLFGLGGGGEDERAAAAAAAATNLMKAEAAPPKPEPEESESPGELFLFKTHLCVELSMFNITSTMCTPLTDVLSLIKVMPGVLEVQEKSQSVRLSLPDDLFDTICVDIEDARISQIGQELRKAPAKRLSEEDPLNKIEQIETAPSRASRRRSTVSSALTTGFNASIGLLLSKQRNATRSSISGSVSSTATRIVDPSIMEALTETDGSGDRRELLDQTLTFDQWRELMTNATRRQLNQGETILREGETSRALYQLVNGTLRAELELAKDGQQQTVIVGRLHAGDFFGERTLLLGGTAAASLVVTSETATVFILNQSTLTSMVTRNPSLLSKLFCFVTFVQMKKLVAVAGIEEAASAGSAAAMVGSADMHDQADMTSIVSNKAFLFILHRYVLSLEESLREKLLPVLECVMSSKRLVEHIAYGNELAARVRTMYNTFVAKDSRQCLPPICLTDKARDNAEKAMATLEKVAMETPSMLRHLFDSTAALCVEELERMALGPFVQSKHFNYLLALRRKESEVLTMQSFQAVRLLGAGGFGQVIEVVKRDCAKRYAMKVMDRGKRRTMKEETEWEGKAVRERQAIGGLSHPLLVNLCYAFQSSGFLTLVMDLCPGNSLARFILRRDGFDGLTTEQVKFVGLEVVCILGYLHENMILYRDLKPENLLLDGAGHVRLIDFDLAILGSNGMVARSKDFAGTPPYMCPEVRLIYHPNANNHRKDYGTEADWWTLGVLLYELSELDLPFGPKPAFLGTFKEQYRKPVRTRNEKLDALLQRLLVYDPAYRLGANGAHEVRADPFWGDGSDAPDWEVIGSAQLESPLLSLVSSATRVGEHQRGDAAGDDAYGQPAKVAMRQDAAEERQRRASAISIASQMVRAEQRDEIMAARENLSGLTHLKDWNFVSPKAISQEYLDQLSSCVSAI